MAPDLIKTTTSAYSMFYDIVNPSVWTGVWSLATFKVYTWFIYLTIIEVQVEITATKQSSLSVAQNMAFL